MGNLFKFQYLLQISGISEYFHDTAVVSAEEFLEYEAGNELVLGEFLWTLEVAKGGKSAFGCCICNERNRLRGL